MTDRSRPTKYKYGDYVTHIPTGDPVLIDHAHGNERDGVVYQAYRRGRMKPFFESELRPMPWKQFRWHRHPRSGWTMMGKTWGFMAVIIHITALLVVALPWVLPVESYFWAVFTSMVGVAIIGGLWLKTYHNFIRRTV